MQGDVADFPRVDEVEPEILIICAMVADQVQTLSRLYRAGLWKNDPSEISQWLKNYSEKQSRSSFLQSEATHEWMLWTSSATDVLIRVLATHTPVTIDRARIVSEAIRQGKLIEQGKKTMRRRASVKDPSRPAHARPADNDSRTQVFNPRKKRDFDAINGGFS
jgi:hypothetical protein